MPRHRLAPAARALLLSFLVVAALSNRATLLKADIVFSNIDAGNDTACCGVMILGGPIELEEAAALFILPAGTNYLMTDAQVVVASGLPFAAPPTFDVSIYSNAFNCSSTCGDAPTALIATTESVVSPGYPPSIVAASPGPPPVLTAGTAYWLVLSDFNSEVLWSAGGSPTPFPSGEDEQMQTLFGFSVGWEGISGDLQFQIDGTPTANSPSGVLPEPNLVFLVAIAFALIALLRLKRGLRNGNAA